MSTNENVPNPLPRWLYPPVLDAWAPDVWAIAALGRVVAVFVYLVGYVVMVLAHAGDGDFRTFVQSLFGRGFLVTAPAVLISVAAVGLRRDAGRTPSPRAATMVRGALVGALLLAAFVAVGSVVGGLAGLPDFGTDAGQAFFELAIDAAAFVAAATGAVWAVVELAAVRRMPAA